MRRYKIQEVIKRRQILLVQVVKEERGTKGAALTTYLSLAGRYCVLMPNTARGGGISRKITTATDRKRLKTIAQDLEVPHGMGLIIRTAGAKRTKQEIKRDYEYLLRLWESIRETTLKSNAPALIYEEEDLVKRAIRDMFDKDIDAVLVDGEEGFLEAREFMRMLMPSQAKKVQLYTDPTPLFVKHRVEDVLQQIHSPVVPLRSGGYLVINQTEALVAVDVNSGRATKERNIEATALKTNLEAADEASRQLRLRDLAGLIVIDFIDMDEAKNNRAVEKRLKDALAEDRARIQMGKISGFGLMEISRQRRRSGVLEGTTHVCEHCQGTGRVRSVESSALQALRAVEMELVRGGAGAVTLRAPPEVALYILNEKRAFLARLLEASGLYVTVLVDDALARADHRVERTETGERPPAPVQEAAVRGGARHFEPVEDSEDVDEDEEAEETEEDIEEEEAELSEGGHEGRGDGSRRGRGRRRRRRGGRRDDGYEARPSEPRVRDDEDEEDVEERERDQGGEGDGDARRRRRRRGRRGGRRMHEEDRGSGRDPYMWVRPRTPSLAEPYVWFDPVELAAGSRPDRGPRPERPERAPERPAPEPARAPEPVAAPTPQPATEAAAEEAAAPKRRRVRAKKPQPGAAEAEAVSAAAEPQAAPESPPETIPEATPVAAEPEPAPPKPRAKTERAPAPLELVMADAPAEPDPNEISAPPPEPKRGWWRRRG
jgi:ribonuclease E